MILGERVAVMGVAFHLTGGVVVTLYHNVIFVKFDEVAAIAADGHVTVLHVAVQALGSLVASRNGINGKLRSSIAVTAHEDILFGSLVGQLVGYGIYATEELDFGVLQQVFQDDGLTDGKDNCVSFQFDGLILIILWGESVFCVIHRCAFLEDNASNLVVAENFFRSPARVDDHAVLTGLATFFFGSRHDVLGLKREHRNLGGTTAFGHTGRIDGHITTANDNDLFIGCL